MAIAKAMFIAGLVAAAFIVWGLFFANPAAAMGPRSQNAQQVCALLSASPELTTVTAIALDMESDGVAVEEAVEILWEAGTVHCPEHFPLLVEWAKLAEAGNAPMPNSRIGNGMAI